MNFSLLPDPGIRGLWASGGLGQAGAIVPFVESRFAFANLVHRIFVDGLTERVLADPFIPRQG